MNKYQPGTVLKRTITDYKGTRSEYWKITDNPRKLFVFSTPSYPVIKCSKTGKEYKTDNGFNVDFVDSGGCQGNEIEIISLSSESVKANIESGNKIGKKKRRVLFLEARIKRDQKELEDLKREMK